MEQPVVETPSTTIEQLAQDVPEVFLACFQIDADFNYRRRYREAAMQQLRDNIAAVGGLIYPVIVRKKEDGRHQLLVGNRRFRAFTDVYGPSAAIKAKVLDVSDAQAIALMMTENGVREDPSVIEDAEGAARMLGICNGDRVEAAARLGWKRDKFDKRLALMNAAQSTRDAYLEDLIGVGHVELLASFRRDVQDNIVAKCREANRWPTLEELKAMGAKAMCSLEAAIFDRSDCSGCPHNTGFQQAMFETAFEGSNCTNRRCYDQKTEAALEIRRAQLEEEYAVVRIVRPGDNETLVLLRATGDRGVGEEQAKTCRTCGDFGACVSAVPDKLGKAFRDVCFNKACNDEKVSAERKRQRDAETAAQDAAAGGQAQTTAASTATGEGAEAAQAAALSSEAAENATAAATATSAGPTASTNSIRNAIKEYREAVWREIFKRQAKKLDVMKSRSLLVALLIHRPGYVNSHEAINAINEALGESVFGTANRPEKILRAVLAFDTQKLATAFNLLAAHVTKDMPIEDIVGFLKALDVRIEDWFRVNEQFFDVLTKVEIDAVCNEIGLAKAAGNTYASLRNGSKKEFVAAMLKVNGFKYDGAVPKLMRWK